MAGYTTAANRNGVLLKYSPSGTLLFATVDNSAGDGEFVGVALTTADEAFVGGYTSVKGNKDFIALLYNNDGTLRWSDVYNGYVNKDDEAQHLVAEGGDKFLISGTSALSTMTVKYVRHDLILPAGESVNAPFVENRGQLMDTDERPADEVRYYTRSNYPNVYVLDDRVSFAFAHIDTVPATQDTMVRVDLTFASHGFGGGATVAVGLERRNDFHNYYLGHIPEGRERVPLENKVLHPNIYDNVDALYGLGEDGFFLRFICKPGSSPGHVRMQFVGNSGLTVDSSGALRVETDLEDLLFAVPTAIFVDEEGEETGAGWAPQFVINLDGTVRFTVDSVPGGSTLIVKTGRERGYGDDECDYYWSTYFGEVGDEKVKGSDVDALGYMYFTGKTSSAMFPTTVDAIFEEMNGPNDAFVACFRQLDEREWITFYGGAMANSFVDDALSIKWNPQNDHVYFVGRTGASDFPLEQSTGYFNGQVISGFRSRGFIVKLDARSGKRSWATFFGDSEKRFDAVTALHIRTNGNVVVGGYSQLVGSSQTAFPFFPDNTPSAIPHIQTQGALYIAEFDPSNAQIWATKLTNELDVAATPVLADITEDSGGRLYVTGNIPLDGENDFIPMGSGSMDFSGFHDVFLIEFSQAKEIVWSTYLGGTSFDYANSVVSSSFGIMGTGTTFSSDFPTVAAGDSGNPLLNDLNHDGTTDIFVCELQNDDFGGKILHWSRFLGGEGEVGESQQYISTHVEDKGESVGNATALLDHNVIAITGSVPNYFSPLVASGCPYYYGNFNRGVSQSGTDAILVIIKNREVVFSTYWGGDNSNAISHDAGTSISKGITPNGSPFVLLSGHTNSREFAGKGITIPVCRELPFLGSYYNDNFLGGTDDAFISKIYYGECLTTGINTPNSHTQNLPIWPNPAGDLISILLPSNGGLATSIHLFDAAGKAVSSVFPTESSFSVSPVTVEIASLPPGFYFVVVQSSGRTYNGKFVKM